MRAQNAKRPNNSIAKQIYVPHPKRYEITLGFVSHCIKGEQSRRRRARVLLSISFIVCNANAFYDCVFRLWNSNMLFFFPFLLFVFFFVPSSSFSLLLPLFCRCVVVSCCILSVPCISFPRSFRSIHSFCSFPVSV